MKLKSVSRIIMLAILALLGFTYWYLSNRLHQLDSQLAKNRLEASQRKFASSLAEAASSELRQYESQTKAKLAKATCRADFAVRTGEQFACAKLTTSTNMDLRLGIYVPSGHHHLCYSSSRIASRQEKALGISEISTDSKPHNLVFLANAPEVLELRVQLGSPMRELTIQVIGKDDQKVHEEKVQLPNLQLRHFINEPRWRETLTYPSELPLNESTQQILRMGISKPVLDLASVEGWSDDVSTGEEEQRWLLRLWIESDAVPCISAFNVHFRRSEIMEKWNLVPRNDQRLADKLFEPYSGGFVQSLRKDALQATSGDQTTNLNPKRK